MSRIIPPEIDVPATGAGDPRIGHLLGSALREQDRSDAVIVGFPTDEGVRRNGGRVGAAEGPAALRHALYRLTPDARCGPHLELLSRTRDLGDVPTSADLESDQRSLAEVLEPHLSREAFVIVLGGGHETSYGHFLGYVRAGRQVEILNWDAHPDVRELTRGQAHSGSPFRQAIEDPSELCRRYTVAGLQPQAVAHHHVEFVRQHGRAIWRDEVSPRVVQELSRGSRAPLLVSFDLDAVGQPEAPGVSAPSPVGLGTVLWFAAAYAAGQSPAVTSADIVELNPRVDVGGQTARVAALTAWWLLRGRAEQG
jgi:formiminoglutamase